MKMNKTQRRRMLKNSGNLLLNLPILLLSLIHISEPTRH